MIFELDHVGVAVADLELGYRQYARLGFRLTARSVHAGARQPGGPVEPWGSANHCAMFRQGYLEVLGLIDATLHSSVKEMLARYHGAHIVAIGCRQPADAVYEAMRARNIPLTAPQILERDAPFGPEGRETRRARFSNAIVPREHYPEARFHYIEHLTRDVLWQPHLLEHPNGAEALSAVWFASDAPGAAAERLAPLFAGNAEALGDGGFRIGLSGDGEIRIVSTQAWRSLVPGAATPPSPAPVAIGFRTRSLGSTRRCLNEGGVVTTDFAPGALAVGPADACGVALVFAESKGTLA